MSPRFLVTIEYLNFTAYTLNNTEKQWSHWELQKLTRGVFNLNTIKGLLWSKSSDFKVLIQVRETGTWQEFLPPAFFFSAATKRGRHYIKNKDKQKLHIQNPPTYAVSHAVSQFSSLQAPYTIKFIHQISLQMIRYVHMFRVFIFIFRVCLTVALSL